MAGQRQYGEVALSLNPLPRGSENRFRSEINAEVIPDAYMPAIEQGVMEALESGTLMGYPVVDVEAVLTGGGLKESLGTDLAYKVAASMACKEALSKGEPFLLDPIMDVEVFVPEEFMGDINGNLSGRSGSIQSMESKGKNHVVMALVPMSEMLDFEPNLTSITGGRGSYFMELSHYEEVPGQLQKKIIEDAVKEGRIREEEE